MKEQVKLSQIIEKQSIVNIGTIGDVSNGKTTTVSQLTGVKTQRHEEEIKENKTINIGYANCKIWKCPVTNRIITTPSHISHKINDENGEIMQLISHISFVDCPGHAELTSTMISGSSTMDGALLLVDATEKQFPPPQTYEHLYVMSMTEVDNYLILHNKLDLVTQDNCLENYRQLTEFLDKNLKGDGHIIPTSAQLGYNMNQVCQYLANGISRPIRDPNTDFRMFIIRSFDLNKPNTKINKLIGGAIGGSLKSGVVKVGDFVEIRPGFVVPSSEGQMSCMPLITQVTSLYSDKEKLDIAFPGGLISIGTNLDPSLTKCNELVGQVIGTPGTLPKIYNQLTVEYKTIGKKKKKLSKINKNEKITICVNAKTVPCVVTNIESNRIITIKLAYPVCIDSGLNLAILRNISDVEDIWVVYAGARLLNGVECQSITYPPEYNDILENIPKREIEIIDDINYKQSTFAPDYHQLLDNITFRETDKEIPVKFIKPKVVRHNRDSIIVNYPSVHDSFDRYKALMGQPSQIDKIKSMLSTGESEVIDISKYLTEFIKSELNTTASVDGDNKLILRGIYIETKIVSVLEKFIHKYSLCTNCQSYNTLAVKKRAGKQKILTIMCLKCNAQMSIT